MKRSFMRAARTRLTGVGLAFLTACLAPSFAAAQTGHVASATGALSVAEWSREVWGAATTSNSDQFFTLLGRLPADHADPAVRGLRAAVDQQMAHAAARKQQRAQLRVELSDAMRENVAAGDLAEALKKANLLLEIVEDKPSFLREPDVLALVATAESRAKEREASGDWLDAQRLFYRLSLLFLEEGRFKADVSRTSERIAFLATYAPERLHRLRSEQLERDGEKPLPPYNALGEDWRSKVVGIDQAMVKRALLRAADRHVDGVPLARMITGGLRSVQTLLETRDLAATFPGLANDPARREFVRDIEGRIAALSAARAADSFDLSRAMSGVLTVNSTTTGLPAEVVLRAFGDGAAAQLDEFSAIVWPDELARFLRTTQGRFQGVGVQIQLDDARNLKVVSPIEGTPAQRAGIKMNDLIRKVDGESTLGISLIQAVDRITGPAGTNVTLSIEREGAPGLIDFTLTRAEIPIYTVKGWKRSGSHEGDWDWFIDPANGVGYLRLTQFTEDTTAHLDAAVNAMRVRGLNGLILDLRYNPGGLLSQAVSVANRFIDDGVIVSQHDGSGVQTEAERARRGLASLAGVPVAVLLNEGSASASEIVAGALQDYARSGRVNAVLVGARSFGKGSVQNIYDLGRGEAIFKLTERYYHLPGGRLIHRRDGAASWGVSPDVAVDMLPKQMEEALLLRQDADVLAVDEAGRVVNDDTRPDPTRLLSDGIDPQLEVALLLLRSQILGRTAGQALLTPAVPASQGG